MRDFPKVEQPCPSCGSLTLALTEAAVVVQVHPGYHVRGTKLPERRRDVIAVSCSSCEFIAEVA